MTRLATAFLMVALSVVGCGGGGGGPGGVDQMKQISATTEAEKGSLCDWFAGKIGGYGAVATCADGFIEAPATKAECITDFPTCAVTVAQFESCVDTLVAAQATCTDQSLASVTADPDCQAVGLAGCFGN